MTLVYEFNTRRSSRSAARRWIRLVGFAALAAAALFSGDFVHAQTPSLADGALVRKLNQRVTVAWNGQELGAALARITDIEDLPIWLDRRVDPTSEVELAARDQPLRTLLDRLAADPAHDCGWTALRSAVYVGPRTSARELATLSELARAAIAKSSAEQRGKWQAPAPWKIARLSEPRNLLADILKNVGAELGQIDAVPHDVWDARSLPAIAPIDRVILLLAGFDSTIAASGDGRTLRVTPIVHPVQMTHDYPANEATGAAAKNLTNHDDSVTVRRQGRRMAITGRWEDHEQIRIALRGRGAEEGPSPTPDSGQPQAPPDLAKRRFTLKITNKPLDPVLTQIANQLQLSIVWDPALDAAASEARGALVSCNVKEVTLDALLKAILTPAKLAFERDGATITIRSAK